MEYYRSNSIGGMPPTNTTDVTNSIINSASDAYASNYWNIPYTDGLSPMKQIEGAFFFKYKFLLFLNLFTILWFKKYVSLNHYIIKMWIYFRKNSDLTAFSILFFGRNCEWNSKKILHSPPKSWMSFLRNPPLWCYAW